jgi:beta-mannosidase
VSTRGLWPPPSLGRSSTGWYHGIDVQELVRPEPFKYIHFPDVKDLGLEIVPTEDGESVALSTERPIKGIVLDVEGEEVKWGDQAIDLVPGDPQIIKAIGLKGRKVKARFLGDGTA